MRERETMRILIVSQYYAPEQFQINDIAPELVKRGHEVTVLTGLPNYPKGEIFEGYRKGESRDENINGVHVIRVDEHPRKHGPLHLLWNYLSFAWNGSRKAKTMNGDFDIVFSYQLSPVTSIYPAVIYSKKHRVPHMSYCLDIWPESAKAHMNFPILYSIISRISRKLYQSCDYISVTSRPFIDYLHDANGIPYDRMSYIPQHADDAMLQQELDATPNDVADFMYAGNMGKGQTLDVIVRATAKLKHRGDFLIHMVGDGSQRQTLEHLAKDLGVDSKVTFYGNQQRERMPDFYRKADALLLTLRGNNAVGNTMPGKLQMYMTTGKPIFGAINGAASEVIAEAACGKCVAAGDAQGLAGLMADYIDHPEKYSACGARAKKYFSEHFTLKKYCDDLETQLKKLVEGRSA